MKSGILKILTAVLLISVLLITQAQAATTLNMDVSKDLNLTKKTDLKLKLAPVASIELLCRNDGVIISWSNIGAAEKVVIEKSLDQKNYTVYATVATNGNGVEDRNVVKMQTYYYRIKALYSSGLESSYSNIVSATPLQDGLPVEWDPSPMISAALSGEGNAVSLNWNFENTNYIKIYKINLERSIDGVKYSVIGSYDPTIATAKDSYVSKNQNYFYRIHIAYGSLQNRYSNVVSVKPTQDGLPGDPPFDNKFGSNGIDTTADTKTTNINNKFDLTNVNLALAESTQDSAGTQKVGHENDMQPGLPAAPSDLTVQWGDGGNLEFKWKDNSNNEDGFTILGSYENNPFSGKSSNLGSMDVLSSCKSFNFDSPNSAMEFNLDSNSTSWKENFSDFIKSGNKVLKFRIRAYNSNGRSEYSNEVSVADLQAAPEKPVLTAAYTHGVVQLVWNGSKSRVSEFIIKRREFGSTAYTEAGKEISGETVSDSDIKKGVIYLYCIDAVGFNNSKSTSKEISVTIDEDAKQPKQQDKTDSKTSFSSASSWAVPELEKAREYNLITNKVSGKYQGNITREEFCSIVVRLYETLSRKDALPAVENPFKDTTDIDILKAVELGVVKGVSKDSFAPGNSITRQEICVMITRALKAAKGNLDTDTSGVGTFSDEDRIADWAIKEVRFASKNGIMKGIGSNSISPLDNTTREQSIILIKRTYELFK